MSKKHFPSLTILVLIGAPITVITKIRIIAKVEILKSTGSKVLDAKVMDALMQAKLESIPMVDRNITYSLIHELEINNPL